MRRVMVGLVVVVMAVGCAQDNVARTQAAIDEVWDGMTPAEQADLCASARLAGLDRTVAQYMSDTPEMDQPTVERWLIIECDAE